jgi:hypothetical protein
MRLRRDALGDAWLKQREVLRARWNSDFPHKKKLIIHIPSTSASEFSRVNFDHLQQLQNSSISCLYELANPDVIVAYVCPVAFGLAEVGYIFRYLEGLGIKSAQSRLHFIVPELITRFKFVVCA